MFVLFPLKERIEVGNNKGRTGVDQYLLPTATPEEEAPASAELLKTTQRRKTLLDLGI